MKKCKVCNIILEGSRMKYCSNRCKKKIYREERRSYMKNNYVPREKYHTKCLNCSTEIIATKNKKYCGSKCYNKSIVKYDCHKCGKKTFYKDGICRNCRERTEMYEKYNMPLDYKLIDKIIPDIREFMIQMNSSGLINLVNAYQIAHYYCIVTNNIYEFDRFEVPEQLVKMIKKLNTFIYEYKQSKA